MAFSHTLVIALLLCFSISDTGSSRVCRLSHLFLCHISKGLLGILNPEGSRLLSLTNAITQLPVSYTATNATEVNTLPGMDHNWHLEQFTEI